MSFSLSFCGYFSTPCHVYCVAFFRSVPMFFLFLCYVLFSSACDRASWDEASVVWCLFSILTFNFQWTQGFSLSYVPDQYKSEFLTCFPFWSVNIKKKTTYQSFYLTVVNRKYTHAMNTNKTIMNSARLSWQPHWEISARLVTQGATSVRLKLPSHLRVLM